MNESWNTMNTSMMMGTKPRDEVSGADLNALLGGRKFGQRNQETPAPFEMNPPIQYSQEDMQELQDFCQKRGIIGVNFSGMNPQTVLRMLRGKMGISEQSTKKGILHG